MKGLAGKLRPNTFTELLKWVGLAQMIQSRRIILRQMILRDSTDPEIQCGGLQHVVAVR